MLTPADRALVARDPALAGLGLLLDADALGDRLGRPVARRYLRYKPGTSCVLGLDVDGERCFALALAAGGRAKLDKARSVAPRGTVLHADDDRLLLVARPAADRDLPVLARLRRDRASALRRALPGVGLDGASLRTLAHKPQRRWVGRLDLVGADPVVLRAHRPGDAAATVRALRVLAGAQVRTPALLGVDRRHGLVAVSWLAGTPLDRLLADGQDLRRHLRATGAALAELHTGPVEGLAQRTADDDAHDLRRAAQAVGVVLPALGEEAGRLAQRLVPLLAAGAGLPVSVHGDLSSDQVVVGDDGRTGLVDLDAARAAAPELDLGSAVAALHAAAVTGGGPDPETAAAALLDGYPGPVDRCLLRAHTSAALLRRAVEPFRSCRASWADEVAELLARAVAVCPAGVRT